MPTYRKSENFEPLRKNTAKNIRSSGNNIPTRNNQPINQRRNSGSVGVVFKTNGAPTDKLGDNNDKNQNPDQSNSKDKGK